jgi:hypothetical protein
MLDLVCMCGRCALQWWNVVLRGAICWREVRVRGICGARCQGLGLGLGLWRTSAPRSKGLVHPDQVSLDKAVERAVKMAEEGWSPGEGYDF